MTEMTYECECSWTPEHSKPCVEDCKCIDCQVERHTESRKEGA